MNKNSDLVLIENYIYFYHLQKHCILPLFPETVSESGSASFQRTAILGRSAPIFTYSSSGPRTISINFILHREMLNELNTTNDKFMNEIRNEETIEELISMLEASVLPKYTNETKAVNPPIIALRLGKTIYIKGIVEQVSHTYKKPIIDDKYQVCDIQFSIQEYEPFDAEAVKTIGSFRGLDVALDKSILKGDSAIYGS